MQTGLQSHERDGKTEWFSIVSLGYAGDTWADALANERALWRKHEDASHDRCIAERDGGIASDAIKVTQADAQMEWYKAYCAMEQRIRHIADQLGIAHEDMKRFL